MLTLPATCSATIVAFRTLFSKRVWEQTQALLVGAILAPAQRTVCSALRVLGLEQEEQFQRFHRVLNRNRWSLSAAARHLLGLVVTALMPSGRLLLVLDDTLERRRGAQISAKGIYHDPVRSSHSHFVKSSGLRWIVIAMIAEIPFARRRWALPVLTLLSPSERYHTKRKQRHKTLPEMARGALLRLARWLPGRRLVCVADSSYAVVDLLAAVRDHLTMITPIRLDACLFEPKPANQTIGRPRKKGAALPKLSSMLTDKRRRWKRIVLGRWYQQNDRSVEILTGTAVWYNSGKPVVPLRWVLVRDPEGKFESRALLSTDPEMSAEEMLECYVERWQLEVTFEETRQHLGIETQRQWSDPAIERTTPVLMALYTIVALMAVDLDRVDAIARRVSAWYVKEHATFSDALAAVRSSLWTQMSFSMSQDDADMQKVPKTLYQRLISTLCYGC